jgi:hypothetical protein
MATLPAPTGFGFGPASTTDETRVRGGRLAPEFPGETGGIF